MDLVDQRADRADKRADRADERADRADQRADRADQRADRVDKRMDRLEHMLRTTGALVRGGMKVVLQMRATQTEMKKPLKDLDFKFEALVDSQLRTDAALRRTDEKFNQLIETLRRRNGNGHK